MNNCYNCEIYYDKKYSYYIQRDTLKQVKLELKEFINNSCDKDLTKYQFLFQTLDEQINWREIGFKAYGKKLIKWEGK